MHTVTIMCNKTYFLMFFPQPLNLIQYYDYTTTFKCEKFIGQILEQMVETNAHCDTSIYKILSASYTIDIHCSSMSP